MKLPRHATIARAKLTDYLLKWRPENDKSGFLSLAGYTKDDPDRLAEDIREQLLSRERHWNKRPSMVTCIALKGS